MIYRRRMILIAVLVIVFIATIMFAFVAQEKTAKDHKGTLVYNQCQEVI